MAAVPVAALLAVAGFIGWRWWIGYEAVPQVVEYGFTSPDLEILRGTTHLSSHSIVRCTPGRVEARLGLAAPPDASIELLDVTLPPFDDVWADLGWVERTETKVMSDPQGELDDLVDFASYRLDSENHVARVMIAWTIRECADTEGYLDLDRIKVTYRAMGRTRSAFVPVGWSLQMTSLDLNDEGDEIGAEFEPFRSGGR